MHPFKIEVKNNNIAAIWDNRFNKPEDITDGSGKFGHLVYTLKTQDIKTESKPEFVPYNDFDRGFTFCSDGVLSDREFDLALKTEESENGLVLELSWGNEALSACGIMLPFNFLGKKNGEWQRQFTFSSPYHTQDKKHYMFYLVRPGGKNLAVIAETEIEGYRVNYSPFLSGHYIMGLQLLTCFDKAYGRKSRLENRVRLHLVPVESYAEALECACGIWNIPSLYYESASAFIGSPFRFIRGRNCEKIKIIPPSGGALFTAGDEYIPREYGIYTAVPYSSGGVSGADVSFFAHGGFAEMFDKACASLEQGRNNILGTGAGGKPIFQPAHLTYRGFDDYNLCEHAMWCLCELKYMQLAGLKEPYAGDTENLLNIVLGRGDVRLDCCTIDGNFFTLNSTRIQEAYNGASILLNAYKTFGKSEYLEAAVALITARLDGDLSEKGAILRRGSDGTTAEIADYTTVTCMIIPVVDLAAELRRRGDLRCEYFETAAEKIADFVVARGLDFPTEGGFDELVNREVEEGSMSCSALTVLYAARFIKCKSEYLQYAERVLSLHDAFTVYTPHPVMFRSTLRWWETIWEGNSDGPAVCYGHAWSIWRAEAEYWYAMLCFDDERLFDSYNCFMTNLSKEDINGNMYAIYQYEPISSGAVSASGAQLDYSDREGFPERTDNTLSRYVFFRGSETWFKTVALLENKILGAEEQDGIILPFVPDFSVLYIGNVKGTYKIKADRKIQIVTDKKYTVKGNGILEIKV